MATLARSVRGAWRSPRASDLVAAATVAILGSTAALSGTGVPGTRSADALTVALLLAQALLLLWRRRLAFVVLLVVWVSVLVYLALGHAPFTTVFSGAVAATYAVTAYGSRTTRIPAAAVSVVAVVAAFVVVAAGGPEPTVTDIVIMELIVAVAWITGDLARTRRDHIRALEERAARLERERDLEAAAAVAAERTRIARELHDVVAHHVSVIVVQAAAARRLGGAVSDERAAALGSIESAGREALTELRTLLGALRGTEGSATLEPQPGLDRLDDLIERTRSSGLDVDLTTEGPRPALPTGIEVSVYRIVQEALTNVLKHADATAVRVRVRFAPDRIDLEVVDDGRRPGVDPGDQGQGLVGMRERVSLFDGTFDAGPLVGGGWRVRASLPLEGVPA